MVKAIMKKGSMHHTELALIELGLRSRSVDFSKIMAQVDGMIKVLGEEQKDDDNTKAYCGKEMKATSEAVEDSEAAIEEMTDQSATLADEIKSLGKEIKEMDKAVTEATEQRKEEQRK